jgi:hypothetical protein
VSCLSAVAAAACLTWKSHHGMHALMRQVGCRSILLKCQGVVCSWISPPAPLGLQLQSPYNTNLLMAGYDEDTGPALFWCDYLATLHQMNICGTGYGACAACDSEIFWMRLYSPGS